MCLYSIFNFFIISTHLLNYFQKKSIFFFQLLNANPTSDYGISYNIIKNII